MSPSTCDVPAVKLQAAAPVLDGGGDADVDAPQRVDHVDHTGETDLDVVVDAESRLVLDRLDQQWCSTQRIGGVELVLARRVLLAGVIGVSRDRDVGVARQTDDRGALPVSGDVQQHHRVRALAGCGVRSGARC